MKSIENTYLTYIMKWKDKLLSELIFQLKNSDRNWNTLLSEINSNGGIGIHMAVFNEPFLSAIIEKRKTIESRFSINRISPFRRIYKGDLVILKQTAGNVIGFFLCGNIQFWVKRKGESFEELESKYGKSICTFYDTNFWRNREGSRYGTLIEIEESHLLKSFSISKQDRTSWVILKERNKPSIFHDLN